MSGQSETEYGSRRAAYDIKKLRAKGMVRKIGQSRRYEPVPGGLRSLTALLVLREQIIRPLLAASGQPEPQSKPAHPYKRLIGSASTSFAYCRYSGQTYTEKRDCTRLWY
jgi:hypothetical protein